MIYDVVEFNYMERYQSGLAIRVKSNINSNTGSRIGIVMDSNYFEEFKDVQLFSIFYDFI